MLKAIALGMAAGIVLAGPALAQPLPPPALDAGHHIILVKKDKDKHDNGRKLGHYKHRGYDDDGYRSRRSSSQRSGTSSRYSSPRYYDSPGYGSSLPPVYVTPPAFYVMPY